MRPSPGRAWLAGGVLLVAGLAGCLAGRPFPGAPDAGLPTAGPGVAVQPGVEDPFRFEVRVTEEAEDGRPIPNATVVFFRNRLLEISPDDFYITSDEVPRDGVLDLTAAHAFEVLAVGRTDADGLVVGLVEDDPRRARPSVAVGGVAGFTNEIILLAWVDSNPMRAETRDPSDFWLAYDPPLVVPLYEERRDVQLEGTMGASVSGAAVAPGTPVVGDPAWDPVDLDLGPSTDGYLGRLTRLDLTLRWSNDGTDHGDLYVLARVGQTWIYGPDTLDPPGTGVSTEFLDADLDGVAGPLPVGPATNSTVITADGLPWTIEGEATFQGARVVLP